MVSKIIQNEEERQREFIDDLLMGRGDMIGEGAAQIAIQTHKESLANLKEYIETEVNSITGLIRNQDEFYRIARNLSNDIDVLNRMIEKYGEFPFCVLDEEVDADQYDDVTPAGRVVIEETI